MKAFITKANKTGGNDSGSATGQGAFEQNSINDEAKLVVTSTGQTPTAGTGADPNTTQLATALTIISQTANSYQDSGVANAYVLSQSGNLTQASTYFEGEIITFETANPNSGAATVNKAALGVKKILLIDGSEMVGGEILSGRINLIKYDSTADGGSGAYRFISNSDLWSQNNILHVQDQKGSGVNGGSFSLGAWRTRDLNTVVKNTITGASLSANQMTFTVPGVYYFKGSAPAYICQRHQCKMEDITNTASVIGTSGYADPSNQVQNRSFVDGFFTVTATTIFELQHQCSFDSLSQGFGVGNTFGINVFSDVVVYKIS